MARAQASRRAGSRPASAGVEQLAADAIAGVLAGRSLTALLDAVSAQAPALDAQARGALRDIASGTVRHLGLLRALSADLLHKPLAHPWLEALIASALYRLVFTRAPDHAVVDQAVRATELAGHGWAKGVVNAVLRRFLREREPRLERARREPEARDGHPRWWSERLARQHPETFPAILAAGNERPPMTLRVNRRRAERDAYRERLRAAGIEAEPIGRDALLLARPVPAEQLPGFADGHVSVQDHGAQLAADFLALAPGLRVLDACAAPGGKAAHVLERADVDLLALDADPRRVQRIEQALARLGLVADVRAGDATRPDDWWDGRPFDRILLDVPCTASGVVRRHPDIKWLRREDDIAGFAGRQRALLDALWPLLAAGGRLVYATCSVFAEENEAQIEAFLARTPAAVPVPLDAGGAATLALLPGPRHDGFWYAAITRR